MNVSRSACALAAVAALAGCASRHRPALPREPRRPARPRVHRESPPLQLVLRYRRVRLPILMYHRIGVEKPWLLAITQRLTVPPSVFVAQMTWLQRHRFHTVTPLQLYDALERARPLPPRPVLITFDDGYRDVLGEAAPVLRRLHMHATAFVITGRISGPDPSFLTWGELRRLRRDGFDIGSHTVTHRDLTALTPPELEHELTASRRILERRLGTRVQWFAYPAGRYDARVLDAAAAAGYVLAFTTRGGSEQDGAHPLELRRFEVQASTDLAGLLGR